MEEILHQLIGGVNHARWCTISSPQKFHQGIKPSQAVQNPMLCCWPVCQHEWSGTGESISVSIAAAGGGGVGGVVVVEEAAAAAVAAAAAGVLPRDGNTELVHIKVLPIANIDIPLQRGMDWGSTFNPKAPTALSIFFSASESGEHSSLEGGCFTRSFISMYKLIVHFEKKNADWVIKPNCCKKIGT